MFAYSRFFTERWTLSGGLGIHNAAEQAVDIGVAGLAAERQGIGSGELDEARTFDPAVSG